MAEKHRGATVREFASATRQLAEPEPAPARVETFEHPVEPEPTTEPKPRRRGKQPPADDGSSS